MTDLNVAPGSIVVVRDQEWLFTSAEQGADGWLVRVRGLSEFVAETTAAFTPASTRSRSKIRSRPRSSLPVLPVIASRGYGLRRYV